MKVKQVNVPQDYAGKFAIFIEDAFTKEECDAMIKETEEKGYEPALVNVGFGRQQYMPDVRNNDRCIIDSFEKAAFIMERIKDHVPAEWSNRKVAGLNERLRYLRYDPGMKFEPHHDGCYKRANGEMSYITMQLYLNEGFKGGSTTFLSNFNDFRSEVVPKTGSVLLFQHDILHEGSRLIEGRKYALRTDVMYYPKK